MTILICIFIFCLCLSASGCRASYAVMDAYDMLDFGSETVPLTADVSEEKAETHTVPPEPTVQPSPSEEPEAVSEDSAETEETIPDEIQSVFDETYELKETEPAAAEPSDSAEETIDSEPVPSVTEYTERETVYSGYSHPTEASVVTDRSVCEEPEPEQEQPTVSAVSEESGEPIDLLFVMGQSNAVGLTDQPSGYAQARMESVLCDSDEIYSSYVPLDDCGRAVSGIDTIGSYVTQYDVSRYISDSVGSETSLAGTELAYKPYTLSSEGSGKTGMDSAIAYKWNQLTGRKVWIANCGYSGSAISSWAQGTVNYEAALETVRDVIKAVDNDPDYHVGRVRMFWLQGESDTFTAQSEYENSFKSLIGGLSSAAEDMRVGIIIPRAMGGNSNPFDSTPAQAALRNVASAYGNVAVVSDLNLSWTDDAAVRNYFSAKYPDGISYPTHGGFSLSVPVSYADVYVHPHYTQTGHNENGFDAAQNMFDTFG